MIRSLRGDVTESGEGWVEVDVHGVGYVVAVPATTALPGQNEPVHLHTYLAVRETALDLYGFIDRTERTMFEVLLGIPKVGPKSALQILGQTTPSLLAEAAEKNDPVYLQKLSGIGKKTCENIVQYLSNKLDLLPVTSSTSADLSTTQTDAIDALIALGYDATTARESILSLESSDATVNSLVTQALKQL